MNLPRLQEYMANANLDAIVSSDPVTVEYLTGYRCWLDTRMHTFLQKPGGSEDLQQPVVMIRADGKRWLVADSLFAMGALGLDEIEAVPVGHPDLFEGPEHPDGLPEENRLAKQLRDRARPDSVVDAVHSILQSECAGSGSFGLDQARMPGGLTQSIRADDHLPWKTCSNLLRLVRMVKTENEIAALAEATAIAEHAARAAARAMTPGTPYTVGRETFLKEAAAQGAEIDHFAIGAAGLGLTEVPWGTVRSNDVMFCDFGCVKAGARSDAGVTLTGSPLSDDLLALYEKLRDAIPHTTAQMKPGMKSSEVFRRIKDHLADQGISDLYPHGHGLGAEVRDYPILVADTGLRIQDDCVNVPADLPLEAGMVLNLEVPLFAPGAFSMQVEQSFVLEQTGCRSLAQQDRNTPWVLG